MIDQKQETLTEIKTCLLHIDLKLFSNLNTVDYDSVCTSNVTFNNTRQLFDELSSLKENEKFLFSHTNQTKTEILNFIKGFNQRFLIKIVATYNQGQLLYYRLNTSELNKHKKDYINVKDYLTDRLSGLNGEIK